MHAQAMPSPPGGHHGGHHHGMAMPLLPQWLSVVWILVLLGVVGLHVWHCYTREGQHRWWHLAHTVMALGMIGMYLLPVMAEPELAEAGLRFFGTGAVLLLAVTVLLGRHEGRLNPLWLASALDMVAMAYMFLPGSLRPAGLTWIVVGYLTCEIGAWLANLWAAPRLGVAAPQARPAAATPGVPATPAAPGAATAVASRRELGLSECSALDVRASLALMAASMAYMLAAMNLM